jgi:hypothetical protein
VTARAGPRSVFAFSVDRLFGGHLPSAAIRMLAGRRVDHHQQHDHSLRRPLLPHRPGRLGALEGEAEHLRGTASQFREASVVRVSLA